MATYLIIYDTKKEATAYHAADKQLTDAIKSISDVYWNHLDNTYLIVSALSASRIEDKLNKHLTNGDKILVVKVCRQHVLEWLPRDGGELAERTRLTDFGSRVRNP